MQGGDWSKGPSYRKLKQGLKFAFEYRSKKETPPVSSVADFGTKAQAIEVHEQQLRTLFRLGVNPRRIANGKEPYTINRVHFHGFRHGCPLNLRFLVPKMTHLEIAMHCRMSLAGLMVYLDHNQGARDPSNRTDEIVGVVSFSDVHVARWCSERSAAVTCDQVRTAMQVMGLDFVSFVEMAVVDLQFFMRQAGTNVVNAGLYVMLSRAHAESVRLYSDMQQERAAARPTREHEARSTEQEEEQAMRAEFERHGLNFDEFRATAAQSLAVQ